MGVGDYLHIFILYVYHIYYKVDSYSLRERGERAAEKEIR